MTRAMVGLFILSIVLVQIFPTQMWIPMVGLGITVVSNFVYIMLSLIIRKRNENTFRVRIEQ